MIVAVIVATYTVRGSIYLTAEYIVIYQAVSQSVNQSMDQNVNLRVQFTFQKRHITSA